MTPTASTSRQARQCRLACLLAMLIVTGCGGAPADRPLLGYVEGEYVRIAAPFAGQLQQLSVRRGSDPFSNTC